MAKNRQVVVRSDHIQQAIPKDSGRCMIADALKDAFPGARRVSVDLQTIRYTDSGNVRRTYLTPGQAQAALARFDDGLSVEPFSFFLSNPIHVSPADDPGRDHGPRPPRTVRVTDNVGTDSRGSKIRGLKVQVTGGHPPPLTKRGTRRVFGMRGLRVNEHGEVQQ